MDIIYQEEQFSDIQSELTPIFEIHWLELANNKAVRPLDVDYEAYKALNDNGLMKIFTVRSEGSLIGYAFFIIANNLHYKNWKYAVNDIYYILPEFRRNHIGTDLVCFCEARLLEAGVKSITIQEKLTSPNKEFFPNMGYKAVETHYEKVLK